MGSGEPEIYRFARFELDALRAELRRDQQPVKIFPRAFDLLLYLVRQRGRMVSREELLAELWPDVTVTAAVLTQTVWELRRALGDGTFGTELIRNSRGRGYRFVAEVELPGGERTQGVSASSVPAAPPAGSAPIQSALRPKPILSYVGREAEMQRLRAALEASLEGRGSVFLLGGEPGIGKTRAAEEVMLLARAQGALALEGHCYEGQGAPPFWPWLQVVRRLTEEHAPEALREHMGAGASDLCRLCPELSALFPEVPEPPERPTDQDRLFVLDSVVNFIVRASAARPLALMLDDLHWADRASLLLLETLSRMAARARILIVGTYRTTELGQASAFASSTAVLAKSCEQLLLSGLSQQEVATLLLGEASGLDQTLAAEVHRITSGNPLFVIHVARLAGDEPGRAALVAGQLGLPDEVREVIAKRLERLPPACVELLRWAAALGQRFRFNDLRQLVECPQEQLLGLLQAASDARIVCEEQLGVYGFTHPMIREAVHQSLRMPERAQLHQRIALAIEASCGPYDVSRLDELAYHFGEAAAIGSAAKAVDYAERAAARAFEATAYETAVEYYDKALQALELMTPADVRRGAELRLARGTALRGAHEDPARVRAAFLEVADQAAARGDAELLARAALGYSGLGPLRIRQVREAGTVDPVEVALLERALGALPEQDSELRALLLGQLAGALYNTRERGRRERLADAAVEMARRAASPESLAEALLMKHRVITAPDQLEQRLALTTEIIELTHTIEAKGLEFDAYLQRALLMMQKGQHVGADADLATALRLAEEMQQSDEKERARGFDLLRMFWEGRYAEGERESARLAQERTRGGLLGIDQGHAIRTLGSAWQQGRPAEAIAPLEALAAKYPLPMVWRCGLAALYATANRLHEARRELERLAVNDFGDLPFDHNWLSCQMYMAVVCADLGDRPRAARVLELLRPYQDRLIWLGIASMYGGPVSHALARVAATLERWAEAEAWFEQTIERDAAMGARVWVAMAQCHYGEMLWRRAAGSDRERARALIDAAFATAAELGIGYVQQRVERLAAAPRLAGLAARG